jgi:hypothetical protein
MSDLSQEGRIGLAITAVRNNPRITIRRAAAIYHVPRSTIQRRMAGTTSKADTHHGRLNLTAAEEEAIVGYVLDLDSRGFSPRRTDVEDMANRLLEKRGPQRVGKNWTDRFIKRRPELRTRFSRVYDYQRALQEDPHVLDAWFRLVTNMRAKYGIQDCDFYNFDETGFAMGMIRPRTVVTRSERVGKPKAIQPGNREWATAICSIAADGHVVPPFLCVAGRFHLAAWYSGGHIPANWVVKTTQNGWTDHDTGLEWLRHFDQHTRVRQKGRHRMLVLDGHESHINAEFDEYCKANDIVPLCLPSHSSHLTQPLDVGVFSPLKKAYGAQISFLARANITHITKDDFFPAFRAAFEAVFTEQNVKGGFRGAGLVPFNPDAVISKLDVKLRMPTPPGTSNGPSQPWVSQTPQTAAEAISQSTFIKDRVTEHQGSSPTPILASVDQLAKAVVANSHQLTLLTGEVKALREANKALSKRRQAKRTRLQDSGPLTSKEASQLLAEKGVIEQEGRDEGAGEGSSKRRKTSARHCGICRKAGHNARTCSEAVDVDTSSDSE